MVFIIIIALSFCKPIFAAGLARITVPAKDDDPTIEAMVWSPCVTPSKQIHVGHFTLEGVRNCSIKGNKLPLVVISHGKGGSMLSHNDTASALADAGFIVAALNHPGDSCGDEGLGQQLKIFETRPRDISRLISFMTEHWEYHDRIAKQAIGVFGFSRGGYTALALSGAIPSLSAGGQHICGNFWSSIHTLCRQLKREGAQLHPHADPRIRAAVVVDPLDLFDAQGLRSVHIPVQLWASEQGGDGVQLAHVEEIRDALPQLATYHIAHGAGHFAYLTPCSTEFKKRNSYICTDPTGFDRVTWHQRMNKAIIIFFRKSFLHIQNNPIP